MNSDKLNELASVHLGKAGDGTIVKPYVTPDDVDETLLVAVPRSLNRVDYGLDDTKLPFEGVDAWNAYEFSTLLENGFPVSGWLKFVYPSDSPNIVESKSVKLYLNSYNMARLIKRTNEFDDIIQRITYDLSYAVGSYVDVNFVGGDIENVSWHNYIMTTKPIMGDFTSLENYCDVNKMKFDTYNEDPNTLDVVPTLNTYNRWRSHSLRSNCRITNQPDWADVYIHIKGVQTVTPESLLQYIVSMRKENHFHEEITECIYKRLWDLLQPEELLVACLYTRRGGIDINPVRASNQLILKDYAAIINANNFCHKTTRQ